MTHSMPKLRLFALCAVALAGACTACSVPNEPIFDDGGGPLDPADAAAADASPIDALRTPDAAPDACVADVERCNGRDDDCDGDLDEGLTGTGAACTVGLGACERTGTLVCSADGLELTCFAVAGPVDEERCGNGIDDDCDGEIDEGFSELDAPCSAGIGACFAAGVMVCAADLLSLECDAVAGLPDLERCANTLDDDCDGETDEGFAELGLSCSAGTGACEQIGAIVCNADASGTVCDAIGGGATDELCNAIDDDCDGDIDDGFYTGTPCDGPDSDACVEGVLVCDGPTAIRCNDDTASTIELCNGVNDDCNAATGDGVADPLLGAPCDGTDADLCATGVGSCVAGIVTCNDTAASTYDLCNGADDDCNPTTPDGQHDPVLGIACDGADGDLCPEGRTACVLGAVACDDPTDTALELCNGLDDDCRAGTLDGTRDPLGALPCDGTDGDLCQEGTMACIAGTLECDDVSTTTLEQCGNGVDDDCTGGDAICAVPPNDLPATPTNISAGGSFIASLGTATDNHNVDCAITGGRDVFYTFTLPAAEVVYVDSFGSTTDVVLKLYPGTCSARGALNFCADDSCAGTQAQRAQELAAGTYCLVVDQKVAATTGLSVLLFVRGGRRGTAIPLASAIYSGTTIGAGNKTSASCLTENAPDVGYFFTLCPATARTVTASTCSRATWDTVLSLRQGSAVSGLELGCSDDACGGQSTVSATLSGAGLFWLVIDGWNTAAAGAYGIQVTM